MTKAKIVQAHCAVCGILFWKYERPSGSPSCCSRKCGRAWALRKKREAKNDAE